MVAKTHEVIEFASLAHAVMTMSTKLVRALYSPIASVKHVSQLKIALPTTFWSANAKGELHHNVLHVLPNATQEHIWNLSAVMVSIHPASLVIFLALHASGPTPISAILVLKEPISILKLTHA